MTLVYAYGGALAVFLVLDALWLGLVARNFYQSRLGHLLADKPNMAAAGIFYLGYIAGVVFFAVRPALDGGALEAGLTGGALGLLAYGTYDATNLATLKGFPARVAVVDALWGACLTGATAMAGWFAAGFAG